MSAPEDSMREVIEAHQRGWNEGFIAGLQHAHEVAESFASSFQAQKAIQAAINDRVSL